MSIENKNNDVCVSQFSNSKNEVHRARVACNVASENSAPIKKNYKNVSCSKNAICNSDLSYKNNATQNDSMSCKNSASCKRDVSCKGSVSYNRNAINANAVSYQSEVRYKNDNGYKSCMIRCSATTKICLWLFLFVACLAVTIGFGSIGGSNGSLNVVPEVETASAAGETWSGNGTSSNPYQIASYADLLALSTACNDGNHYVDTYFKLTADITIAAADWVPIGFSISTSETPSVYFSGILDGTEHSVTFNNVVAIDISVGYAAYTYAGALFGYVQNGRVLNVKVKFNVGDNSILNVTRSSSYSQSIFTGGIVGGCQSTDTENPIIQGCSIIGGPFKYEFSMYGTSYFGGIVGMANSGIVDNCTLDTNLTVNGIISYIGGIVGGSEDKVTNCSINADVGFSSDISATYQWDWGGIVGDGNLIENCTFNGGSFTCNIAGKYLNNVGVIAGAATTIKKCKVIKGADSSKSIDIQQGNASTSSGNSSGIIAGSCSYVQECYINANINYLAAVGDGKSYAGLVVGYTVEVKNCKVDVSIANYEDSSRTYFGHIAGAVTTATSNGSTVNPSITNCFIQISTTASQPTNNAQVCAYIYRGTLTTYNCVFIGVTGLKFTGDIAATAGGSYGLYASSSDVPALKKTSTYAGTGTNGYTWNSAAPWNFESVWFIETENETYPTLQFMGPCTVTIKVTTSAGAGGVVGTDKYILYKLNSAGAVVNQFVVSHNSEIVFSTKRGEKITLLTTYRSYLYWTVDGTQVEKYEFTPSVDTEINIHIAAPAVINNSIVI